jgi:hypothetical protein
MQNNRKYDIEGEGKELLNFMFLYLKEFQICVGKLEKRKNNSTMARSKHC